MSLRQLLDLRLERRRRQIRAFRRGRDLRPLSDRTCAIRRGDILCCVTLRNERIRLPWFLDYYRGLGVNHFLIVDNASNDGSGAYLAAEPDVSSWQCEASYRHAGFGIDWVNHLLARYGTGHWTLTVDPDEFLIYPFCDVRPLRALTDWLDGCGVHAFPAMLLDMYPKGGLDAQAYRAGEDPFATAAWFDAGNYTIRRDPRRDNLWIQGGPRARTFFAGSPEQAPALNKIPLVRWRRGTVFASSSHALLPRGLNRLYDAWGGERISGCLLHAKFLSGFADKVAEEAWRGEHYAGGREYRAYAQASAAAGTVGFWTSVSSEYISWRQLEILGLMSRGEWA